MRRFIAQAPQHAGTDALLLASQRGMSRSLNNIGKNFNQFADDVVERGEDQFLNKIASADSQEALQNLLKHSSGVNPQKLQTLVNQRLSAFKTNENEQLQAGVDQNYQDPSYKLTEVENRLLTPRQSTLRNSALSKSFMDQYLSPERGNTATERAQNLSNLRNNPQFRAESPDVQKHIENQFLQHQGSDIKNINSLSAAEQFDNTVAEKKLKSQRADRIEADRIEVASDRKQTRREKDAERELISRLNKDDVLFSPAEYTSLSSSAQKTYDRRKATPVIKLYSSLGSNNEERVRSYLEMTQAEDFQRLSYPQQELVAKQVRKRNGLTEKSIADTLQFLTPPGKDSGNESQWYNPVSWFGGSSEPTEQGQQPSVQQQQPATQLSSATRNHVIKLLQNGATVQQLRQSQLYRNNPAGIDELLLSFGG